MTREEADHILSTIAVSLERPSPPDPYMRAAVRMQQANVIAAQFATELGIATEELATVLDRVQKLRLDMLAWTEATERYARDAARLWPDCPWNNAGKGECPK